MPFVPIPRLKAADQVAEALRDAILGGRFAAGEALPSERDLAEQFAVNRSTVREALRHLDTLGLVETRHGGKTRVRDFLVGAGLQLLPFLVAPGGEVDAALMVDLLRLRAVLLGFTASLAARADAPPDAVNDALAALEAASTPEALQAADWDFFQVLVARGGNRVLALLVNAIGEVYAQNRTLFLLIYQPGLFDLAPHRVVRDAVVAGDASRARAAFEAYGFAALGEVANG